MAVLGPFLALATLVHAQVEDQRLHLRYGVFDPTRDAPVIPAPLLAGGDTNLQIVQFDHAFTDADRDRLRRLGATLCSPLPHNALVVRIAAGKAAALATATGVRWVGPYHPAYRLEGALLTELAAGAPMPVRKYDMVMTDKRRDKRALQQRVEAIGGKVTDRHEQGLLFTAELTGPQLVSAARFDEVLWIDRWSAPELDMNNARIVQGSNHIEALRGYIGTGIRGHVYEGVEANHQDFTVPMTNVRSSGAATDHGHCTAGCIFGNGTSHQNARGHAPGAIGFYTEYASVTAGWSRNMVIGDVVNVHNCMFTSASWGGTRTTQYTSTSADSDDIVFDHRIPWTQSQSNAGNQNSRPEAWAKNVISIGGVMHYDNSNPLDDNWGGGGSTGPAADGRIKPDLCNFYDMVWTSDRTGSAGYSNSNSTTGFNGTSAATPIVAGTNALAIEMYLAGEFNHTPRVAGGTPFQNRPYAQTVKALQIACATPYQFTQGNRYQLGWGYPRVDKMFDRRHVISIIPEDRPITQGATHTYTVDVPSGMDELKVCLTFLDPAGNPAAALAAVNDLTLQVTAPGGGTRYWGNHGLTTTNASTSGGLANTTDTVECVFVPQPTPGQWTIEVTAPLIAQDAHLATTATDATYALVINGATNMNGVPCTRHVPNDRAGIANEDE
ncbi:MAG: S8 family serine peptidase, partial [Planctomycetes bacterium]|nr:S8 family serine peptidase [Planctomycetota bacterium]